MTNVRIVWTIALVIGGSAPWSIAAQPTEVGRTVAGITVGVDTLDRVRSLYGRGAPTTVDDVTTLCYHIVQQHAYLSISTFQRQNRVQRILLTTISSADPGCHEATPRDMPVLTGSHGIKLGDSFQRVVGALGKPSATGTLPTGDNPLQYAEYAIPGGRVTCQFQGDTLVLIAIGLD